MLRGTKKPSAVFADRGMEVLDSVDYRKSLLGSTTKLVLSLPSGDTEVYFLKVQ